MKRASTPATSCGPKSCSRFVTVDWQPDFSVKVGWVAAIYDGDDLEVSTSVADFTIPEDGSQSWVIDLGTGGAWLDRAHVELTVSNNRQP